MSDDNLPEADAVEGAPHPRLTLQVFGHDAAQTEVLQALTGGRAHHAWLLTGPKGIGKATFAWSMARFLLAGLAGPREDGLFGETPPPDSLAIPIDHPVHSRIAALSDPGCLLIRRPWDADKKRFKAQITVDEIRKLNSFFGLSATDGGHRVVIIDSVDELNPSAANALLKVLEEPPKQATLLLVSHQPARLLPTIRSRCRTLRFAPLQPDMLDAAMTQAGAPAETSVALAELAAGSVGEALRLAAMDGPQLYGRIIDLFAQAPNMDRQVARSLAEFAATRGAEDRLNLFLRLLDLALVRLARTAAGHPPATDAASQETETWARLSGLKPAKTWADLQQSLSARLGHGLAVNVDPQSLVMDALLQVNDAAR